jgi:dTDP-4-amino-4,6-dideoxygalactose transaminase
MASGQLAQGPEVLALESEGGALLGHSGGVATGSGSQALLAALMSLGLGVGSRIGIPAFTCSAVLYAVEWSGAAAVLLDSAEGELAPDPTAVEAVGPLDAVILVHPWGIPLDASAWKGVAPILIEDCAQSIGARWEDQVVGSVGAASITSFYATKMLCAGEGGLLASSDPEVLERARGLRDYDEHPEHARRFNLKMTDLQAAMARVQIDRLGEFMERRRLLAERYDAEVDRFGFRCVTAADNATPSRYRYICWSPVGVSSLLERCQQEGVHCRRPVPVTLDRLLGITPLPNASHAWEHLISLPIYPTLTENEQGRVLDVLEASLSKAGAE